MCFLTVETPALELMLSSHPPHRKIYILYNVVTSKSRLVKAREPHLELGRGNCGATISPPCCSIFFIVCSRW